MSYLNITGILCLKTANFRPIWDRCYDFKNILGKKIGEKIGVFCSNYCHFLQKFDHNIGF
jgi:hypothetical protein